MERWKGKVAVVTGASSGIGAALCLELARAEIIVIGLARRVIKIEELKQQLSSAEQGRLFARYCDITKIETVEAVFKWIEIRFGGCNILVNNAGILRCTMVLAQENEQDLLDVMDTNFSGYIFCIKAAYRMMKKYDSDGHIVNLNSVFGHMPLGTASLRMAPLFNLYPTSKHALVALVETIRDELNYLQIKKIKISCISPSFVKTDIIDAGGYPTTYKMFQRYNHLQIRDIIEGILFILGTPPNVQVHDILIRAVGEEF